MTTHKKTAALRVLIPNFIQIGFITRPCAADVSTYVATVPELPGCHTQARSLDKLIGRIREAIELCLEVEREVRPRTEFLGVQRVSV